MSTGRVDEADALVHKAANITARLTTPVDQVNALYLVAIAQLRGGDKAGYRESCARLIHLPVDGADDSTRLRRFWIACLGPQTREDARTALRLAEAFVGNNSFGAPYLNDLDLGAALYRCGQYERAAERLLASIAAYPSDPPIGYGRRAWPQLFLVMCRSQQGQRGESRRLLDEARSAVEDELRSPSVNFFGRAQLEALLREAEELVELGPTDRAPNAASNKPAQFAPTTD